MVFSFLKRAPAPPEPSVPDGTLVYAVGDIHGRSDCLETVFERIDADPRRADADRHVEVYLGDYVDRGPDTRGVIDMLIARRAAREVVTLCGNHERVMQTVLADPGALPNWVQFGGLATMASYGVAATPPRDAADLMARRAEWLAVFPEAHARFLSELELSTTVGDYFFVHAGVRPGVDLADQREADLLWIRADFLNSKKWHGKMIVHGHTPVDIADFRDNRINIDTGACFSGKLTCLALWGREKSVLE